MPHSPKISMDYIGQLQFVIEELYEVKSTHRHSEPVKLSFDGKVVWDGAVEVFALRKHPEALIAYAWSHATDDPEVPMTSVTVLHVPPVLSAKAAVQVAVFEWLKGLQPSSLVSKPKCRSRKPRSTIHGVILDSAEPFSASR